MSISVITNTLNYSFSESLTTKAYVTIVVYRPVYVLASLFAPNLVGSNGTINSTAVDPVVDIVRSVGGNDYVADLLINSHSIVQITVQEGGANVNPLTSVATLLDESKNILQTGTSTFVSTGVQQYVILPASIVSPGLYTLKWVVTTTSGFQEQFNIKLSADFDL